MSQTKEINKLLKNKNVNICVNDETIKLPQITDDNKINNLKKLLIEIERLNESKVRLLSSLVKDGVATISIKNRGSHYKITIITDN